MSSPIIFEKGTRDFSTLGLGLLSDAIQATTTEELNGQFIFEMDYPISGNNADLIKENRIIVVNSGHILKRQGFIIRQIVRKIDLTMTVYAEHVSYATLDVALAPIGTISGDAKTALENWKRMLVPAVDFTVDSDILTTNSTKIGAPEFETARQGLGGHAGSILDVWGGEYQFDNWHIRLLKQRGKSANAIIAYGRNLISFEQDTNIADTYTSVYPYYQENSGDEENKTHFLPERIVDSEFVGKYPNPKVLMLDLSNKFKDVADYSETKLRNYALSYIQSNNIGVPKVNMKISTVDLSRATGGFSEDIDLGDTVNVYFEKLGITTSAKVIKAVWNVLSDDYDKFEIGARRASLTESISELATTADENANKALNQALVALQSADGKSTIYYLNSSDPWPTNPKENDTAFVKDGENGIMYRYMFNNETGVFSWVKILDSMSADQIKQRVSDALESGKAYSDQLVADNVAQVNAVLDDVQAKQADLTAQQAELDTKAQGYADKALADAKANTLATATQTAKDAQDALAKAKTDLTTSLNKEVTDRANAVTALDTKAKGYADTAKADAINAATTADGVINKKIDDTASSITSTISQNKTDTDGKITTAQSTATQALNGLATKVSQTVYDAKTGQLQTDLNTTTATANTAKTDIVAIKSDNTKQDARMTTIESDANGTKTTVSNLQTDLGKANGSITTLQQRAAGIEATVSTLGQINQLLNTEFTPDFAGWYLSTNANPTDVVTTQLTPMGTDGFGSNVVSHKGGGNWINSAPIPVTAGMALSFSSRLSVPKAVTSGTPLALYIKAFDANNGQVLSAGYNVPISQLTATPTTFKIEKVVMPAGAVKAFAIYGWNVGDEVYISQPMLVFKDKVGAYVQGAYSNSISTAKAQLTADQATTSLNNYKTDADGRISKAQADIIVNANAITQKVSQSDYNAKTGDLTTKVNTAQSTADSATSTIGAYKTSNDARVASAESKITANATAITQKVSQTDYNQKTGELSGKISEVSQTAGKISQSVSDVKAQVDGLSVGGRNLLLDTSTRTAVGPNAVNNTPSAFRWTLAGGIKVGDLYTAWGSNAPISLSFDWSITGATIAGAFNAQWNGAPWGIGVTGAPGITVSSTNTSGHYTWSSTTQPGWSGSTATQFTFRTDNLQGTLTITNLKFEQGNLPTAWSPAPEDTDNKISTVSQTVDSISSIVSDPTTGLTKRVQTAEGSISTVQSNVSDLQSKQTQTANGLTTEISNRATGDTNTLTQAKDFTTSSISNSESGMRSLITQTSDAIIAKIEATNLVTNSEFDPDNVGWYKLPADGSTIDVSGKVTTPIKSYYADWDAVNGSRGMEFGATTGTWITSEPVRASSTGTYSISVLAGRPIAPATAVTMDFRLGLWDKDKKYITSVGSTNPLNGTTYLPLKYYKSENITVPSNTAFVSFVLGHSGSGTPDAIYHPMINHGATISPYTPTYGTTASSTVLSLLKDNWSIGIADNAGAITNGIVGNSTNMSLISNNVVINAPSTQIKGTAWINSAMIGNGAIGTAQIGDASITSAKIASLDVAKLTGNVSSFIQSNWNGVFASTMIDNTGMSINGGSTTTKFDTSGAHYSNSSGISATYSFGKWSDQSGRATSSTGLYLGATGSENAFINILGTNGAAALVLAGSAMDYGANLNVMQGTLNSYVNVNIRTQLHFKGNKYNSPSYIEINESNRTFNFFTGGGSVGGGNYFYFNQNVISAGTFSSTSVLSKKNVKSVYDEDALGEIAKTQLVNFEYKNRIGQNHVSPIIDDVNSEKEYYIPKTILGQDNEYVDLYSMISMTWKAIQQLNEKIGEK